MSIDNKNSQTQQSCLTDVKCRFFSVYQFSNVCFEGISNSVWNTGVCLVFGYYVNNGDKGRIYVKDTTPLLLKPISKITKDQLQKLFSLEFPFYLIFNSYEFMCKYDTINYFITSHVNKMSYLKIIDFKDDKKYIDFNYKTISYAGIDFLRKLGYAVPFDEYSVEDLVSFGWVRLV